jgi:HSP20 family molecular chaperone IbpA
MAKDVARTSWWPDLVGLVEEWPARLERVGEGALRIEDFVEDGTYVLRAEIPGVDPDKDVEITVDDGVLTVRAERSEEKKDGRRTEFRYGSLVRRVTLPAGADTHRIRAGYEDGMLTVRVPLAEAATPVTRIPVTRGG